MFDQNLSKRYFRMKNNARANLTTEIHHGLGLTLNYAQMMNNSKLPPVQAG